MFKLFFLLTVIPLVLSECVDHNTEEDCLSECICAWCSSRNNITACVTGSYADKCDFWGGKVVSFAQDTKHCKDRIVTIVLSVVIPVVIVIAIIIIVILCICKKITCCC